MSRVDIGARKIFNYGYGYDCTGELKANSCASVPNHLIASNEGPWREIGRLANNEEYLAIQDPMGRVEARLGLIEQKIGRTDDTRRLIEMIARTK